MDEPMILREESAGTREVLVDGLLKCEISPDMLNIATLLGNAKAIEAAVEGMNLERNIYRVRNRKQPFTRAQIEFWQAIKRNGLSAPQANNSLS